ncbi:hypothetical protein COCON_G00053880 [Conger conger]|uniref:Uncharacterized protein n=1 Tax=Conger conger TaxID=82655 RepID=A0A9Q1I517_CONCO|nr:hypothetical protein COCON_G00053880 [Conger conger]
MTMVPPKRIQCFTQGNLAVLNESGPAGDWKECRIFFLKCHVVELWRCIIKKKKRTRTVAAAERLPGLPPEMLSPPVPRYEREARHCGETGGWGFRIDCGTVRRWDCANVGRSDTPERCISSVALGAGLEWPFKNADHHVDKRKREGQEALLV